MSRRPLVLALAFALAAPAAHATDLMQAYDLARSGDPTLKASQSTAASQKEQKVQARAALLPQLDGSASLGVTHYIDPRSAAGNGKSSSLGVNLNQSIFDWSRIANLRASQYTAKAADYDIAAAQQDLIIRTSTAYFNVLVAMESLTAAKTNEVAAKKQYDYAQKRLDVGMAPITDVHEARAEYDSARADTILAQNALDDSKRALTEITDQPINGYQGLPDDFRPELPSNESSDAWVDKAGNQNPTLKSYELGVKAAEENVSSARGAHYPTLSLGASWGKDRGWYAEQGIDTNTHGENVNIGLTLTVPIFSGGATQSAVRQAINSRDIAQDNYEVQKRALARNTASAYQTVVAGISEIEARRLAVVSAQSAYDAATVGLEVGNRTVLDVLQNQHSLFAAKVDYATAKYQFLLSLLQLKQAGGTLDVNDLQNVNRYLTVDAESRLNDVSADAADAENAAGSMPAPTNTP